ncbi:MAG TPA: methyltransferase domain-containing protein, partial [Bryobacteraceae bacterium]|nr:methyltransferase domain-containing protein [Bryobacteraceae bacterium]
MTKKVQCAGCGLPLPPPFLDLGESPLANSYVDPTAPQGEFRAPLAVAFCANCYLVQLTHVVPPRQLFFSYLYFSSYSDSYLRHAQNMASELCDRFQLGPDSTVVEVASNDGYLLQYFQQRGVRVLGIDPAENISETARRRGIPTWTRFFGHDLLPELERAMGKVDVIIGNNVLAHVPKINAFLQAIHDALSDGGHAVFEVPYILDLLEKNEY